MTRDGGPPTVRDHRSRSYELRAKLASGAEGAVWRTDHPKLLVKIRAEDPEVVSRDLRRVQRLPLAGLQLAKPEALVAGEPGVGFVMEFESDREPLAQWLEVGGDDVAGWWRSRGGTEGRLRILGSVAGAVAGLHRRGVVVGDISPRNVLIASPSHPVPAVLIDPDGLHYPEDPPPGGPRFSAPHVAPEVISGRSGHDLRSDAFALALLTAHAMLLEHPFRGVAVVHGASDMERRALEGNLPWVYDPEDTSNPPASPRVLEDVVGSEVSLLLHRAFGAGRDVPSVRPTAAALAHALYRAADGCRRCDHCGDGGPGATCVSCGEPLLEGTKLYCPADPRASLTLWEGVQRIMNRRLVTGALHRGNEPALLVTSGSGGLRLEVPEDSTAAVVQAGHEDALLPGRPRRVMSNVGELIVLGSTFQLGSTVGGVAA